MEIKLNLSTNIIRDADRELKYIPTPNAIKISNQISNDYKQGVRTFNVVGAYGTGKSTFLWALEQTLKAKKTYLTLNLITKPKVGFIKIVGTYSSIKHSFEDMLGVVKDSPAETIFSEIYNRYHDLGSNGLLVIMVDEFGKFLEYASENQPEKELYFIQQLAEFANNQDYNILFVSTVHQNFDAYALHLNPYQRQEWAKVKGRFREIGFNEPLEQLLYLAAEHLEESFVPKKMEKNVTALVDLLAASKVFKVNHEYIAQIAKKLFPLDIVAANVLTASLQKYGQNERSLFSFLNSGDDTGLNKKSKLDEGFYNLADIHDYLVQNYYSFLNSRYNPDFNAWKSIRASIEKVEALFDGPILVEYLNIIKAIGLLSMNTQSGAILDHNFYIKYGSQAFGYTKVSQLLEDLESKKIILYRNYSQRFILFEGTDLDIQGALYEAGNKIEEITDVVSLLKKNYALSSVIAKRNMFLTGTPRLFEYRISAVPITDRPEGEVDGFINLVFNEKNILPEIKEISSKNGEAVLYCFYRNSKEIKELLFEIEKTRKVIEENPEDKVAREELKNIQIHQQNLLNHKIIKNLYSNKTQVVWVFGGKEKILKSQREFNEYLSEICQSIYSKTPYFNNELVNKHKISSSIHVAKRNYFKALVNNWDLPDLGFPDNKFPPEKTIFMSLLANNGILGSEQNLAGVSFKPNEQNGFIALWERSTLFLRDAIVSKKNLTDFTDLLKAKPFKLKQGFIDFWIPTFLFIKRDEFALFGQMGYIPYLTEEVIDLLSKRPMEFQIKTFALEGVKLDIFNSYRMILNQQSSTTIGSQSFIDTIKPFLVFYRGLFDYAKQTKRLSKEAIAIRQAIANSKDPEESFFEAFPLALGYTISSIQKDRAELQKYIMALQSSIKEIRSSYDALVGRFESFIQDKFFGEAIEFEVYKYRFQQRFHKIHRHLLMQDQKSFLMRIDSEIDDRDAWLNSLAQSLTGKSMNKFTDENEVLLYDKFAEMILALDSLNDIARINFDHDKEIVVDVQINSYNSGMSKTMIRMPKGKSAEMEELENSIRQLLSKDKSIDVAALAAVLKDLL